MSEEIYQLRMSSPKKAMVRSFMERSGSREMTIREVSAGSGVCCSTARKWLNAFARKGLVSMRASGKLRITMFYRWRKKK